ncbi:bifunctional 2-C-methyl-D-erythritol 4-phosphate cytidylyltransferase/2-C-methyl-D-erythritol 2,4-cyclodiphosphate synthase [Henriciella litoralis]|uniref:bifunctional 2-C-methyl-D-erythritol 4-phosphate cytidylyltransferase/2-C-methyl-D-erythritol 2,4-cyclodiphosphate synthase n=1 Tax=Henriciella litoralis TaxID=568102 RepID=UPI000A0614F5|nr:bifunctional 2-C-methyl-D-erythritol 4-phosphate cytidylyltransferase/2-C-methyl-D-erythritol 2,4-cyclodiphosphate synthase [Henriciella litoralis]
MKVHAIIVAAGSGTRAGSSMPKQFQMLAGKPVLRWSLEALNSHRAIDSICLVLPDGTAADDLTAGLQQQPILLATGGVTRSDSVLNGLRAIPGSSDQDIVMIHDAARPGLSHAVIDLLIDALSRKDAAAPALPVVDALKRNSSDGITAVDRTSLFRIQTPQAFRFASIFEALENGASDHVDDLAAIESIGCSIELVKGDEQLSKITYPEDFGRISRLMFDDRMEFRTGSGFDVHAFEPGDHVTLCGVSIPHGSGLAGHSDADVGWHALTDAIFGALALGDLGDHFPPSDQKWKNADSSVFLLHAVDLAKAQGWTIGNCDITLICEAPKVKPHRLAMRERTAELIGVDVDRVSLKATTTEGLGFTGRREGIAAQAVVLLEKEEKKGAQ